VRLYEQTHFLYLQPQQPLLNLMTPRNAFGKRKVDIKRVLIENKYLDRTHHLSIYDFRSVSIQNK